MAKITMSVEWLSHRRLMLELYIDRAGPDLTAAIEVDASTFCDFDRLEVFLRENVKPRISEGRVDVIDWADVRPAWRDAMKVAVTFDENGRWCVDRQSMLLHAEVGGLGLLCVVTMDFLSPDDVTPDGNRAIDRFNARRAEIEERLWQRIHAGAFTGENDNQVVLDAC